jgi:hypothetical protein
MTAEAIKHRAGLWLKLRKTPSTVWGRDVSGHKCALHHLESRVNKTRNCGTRGPPFPRPGKPVGCEVRPPAKPVGCDDATPNPGDELKNRFVVVALALVEVHSKIHCLEVVGNWVGIGGTGGTTAVAAGNCYFGQGNAEDFVVETVGFAETEG